MLSFKKFIHQNIKEKSITGSKKQYEAAHW